MFVSQTTIRVHLAKKFMKLI